MESFKDLLKSVDVVTINCMQMPQSILTQIEELMITPSKKMVVIVLDEIDVIDQETLYKLFKWVVLPYSNLILIGITNTMDLSDHILPRLQSHAKYQPQILHFPSYTKDQIVTILKEKTWEQLGVGH